jgi:hypothetical protein
MAIWHCHGTPVRYHDSMERDRNQVVVALGDGKEGQRVKALLAKAAERAGQSLSSWARERLLVAAGIRSETPAEPLVQVQIGAMRVTTLDLRAVTAMQVASMQQLAALISGQWVMLGTDDADALFERWMHIRRASTS